jgi:hypothetical protein
MLHFHITCYVLTIQELGQSNISLVKKNQLKESFEKILGELQAVTKAKTAADQKMVSLASSGTELMSRSPMRSSSTLTPTPTRMSLSASLVSVVTQR